MLSDEKTFCLTIFETKSIQITKRRCIQKLPNRKTMKFQINYFWSFKLVWSFGTSIKIFFKKINACTLFSYPLADSDLNFLRIPGGLDEFILPWETVKRFRNSFLLFVNSSSVFINNSVFSFTLSYLNESISITQRQMLNKIIYKDSKSFQGHLLSKWQRNSVSQSWSGGEKYLIIQWTRAENYDRAFVGEDDRR